MYNKNTDFFSDITETNTIYINMEEGVFYFIPPFANIVFRLLLNGKSIEEIEKFCANIPEVPEDYKKRIAKVYSKLLSFKLIVESEEPSNIPEVELSDYLVQSLQEDDFAYTIEPSNDVQRLLLDDPIHDVSLDGWTPTIK